ncbi:hypothetical protein G8A07_22350 [Roseateles sp. DAIF2]|uniref:hypothetical protein n=1 Tax=Roseateles sp. DAIF2 TaxID=2714952 RepID=UPI0018A27B94|nr:hypothetical protein [Roseateles sp. DAIF2]QPF75389.1 hypothetical protein G8A07_22350 [Roseateles sp. DAIF2]
MKNAIETQTPAIDSKVHALTQRALDAVHQQTDGLVQGAERARRRGIAYVEQQPVKSVLVAAAAGAALSAVLGLLMRSRINH